jgi:hypothetical protein
MKKFARYTLLALGFVIVPDAFGRCVKISLYDSWTRADIIFTGTVVEPIIRGPFSSNVSFKNQKKIKGEGDSIPSIFHSSAIEGVRFEPGREYLVFASKPSSIPSCNYSKPTWIKMGALSLTDYEAELAAIQFLKSNPTDENGSEKILREKKAEELRKNAETVCEASLIPQEACLSAWENCLGSVNFHYFINCSYSYFQQISKKRI